MKYTPKKITDKVNVTKVYTLVNFASLLVTPIMKYTPKEITEEVNVTKVHPLVNFASLLGTTIVVSAAIYLGLGFVAGQLATRIDPETEIKIGSAA